MVMQLWQSLMVIWIFLLLIEDMEQLSCCLIHTFNTLQVLCSNTHTHTHPFNGPFSGTTWVSRYQKGKTNLDLLKQEMVSGSGVSWAICKSAPSSRQITMPAPHHSVFTCRMPFLLPNQQCKSTEGCVVTLWLFADAIIYCIYTCYNSESIHLSRGGFVSKVPNVLSWVLAQRIASTCLTLCCKKIQVPPKIWVLQLALAGN